MAMVCMAQGSPWRIVAIDNMFIPHPSILFRTVYFPSLGQCDYDVNKLRRRKPDGPSPSTFPLLVSPSLQSLSSFKSTLVRSFLSR